MLGIWGLASGEVINEIYCWTSRSLMLPVQTLIDDLNITAPPYSVKFIGASDLSLSLSVTLLYYNYYCHYLFVHRVHNNRRYYN